jgi:hypothetical protein
VDAPRTDRCSNRCCPQIFLILLSGENPGTKATATAFPQSVRPLRCLSGNCFYNLLKKQQRDSSCGEIWCYHREKSKAWKENVGKIENWTYNETEDTWTCPAGQTLHFRKETKETLESGYEVRKRHYRSSTCEGCPLKERCTKAAGNREVVVSLEWLRYQEQARQILRSEEGYALCVQRMTEPESVFG